jgi:hypothetical protein
MSNRMWFESEEEDDFECLPDGESFTDKILIAVIFAGFILAVIFVPNLIAR